MPPQYEEESLIRDNSHTSSYEDESLDGSGAAHMYDRRAENGTNTSHESFDIDDEHYHYADSPLRGSTFPSVDNLLPTLPSPRHPNFAVGLLQRFWHAMDGPAKLRDPHVTPVFRALQHFPNELTSRWPTLVTRSFLVAFLALWTLTFYVIAKNSILQVPRVDDTPVDILTCGTTFDVWLGKNEFCGVNATLCGAMEPSTTEFTFKCPAGCKEDSYTWSYTPVGDYESIYRSYVIGGADNVYRADSYVCASLLHRGYMKNSAGKCGRITFQGAQPAFQGSAGKSGIESLSFDSWFPQSFSVEDDFMQNFSVSGCHDLRFVIVWLNIGLSVVFSYFTTSGLIFYWVMMILGFWTVALGSNPPWIHSYNLSAEEMVGELVSASFRRFLPYMLGVYVLWRASGRGLLLDLKEHLSKTVFWVTGFWVAVMENYTFSSLPINRLIISDIKQQKGGFLALIIIVGIILSAAIGQAYVIWRMGKFKKYISVYLLMILGLVLLANIPNQTLRIHHYIIGLLLVPGVGFKTTPGLLYQGLLCGLYVSGIARWDFDSIVETAIQLNRGDALNVGGLPELLGPVFGGNGTSGGVTLTWSDIGQTALALGDDSLMRLWSGFSLVLNDIEYYRGPATSFDLGAWLAAADVPAAVEKIYVRLAFANIMPSIDTTGDYTQAGIVNLATGEWTAPAPGPA